MAHIGKPDELGLFEIKESAEFGKSIKQGNFTKIHPVLNINEKTT